MEPGSRNTVLTPRRAAVGGRADYLLDVIGGHHAAVVDALAQAGGALYDADGRFAAVINQQQRVSRRFFDAQRAVLRLWAECDRDVAAIVSASGADEGDVPAVFRLPTELPPTDARTWRPAELALRADVESAFLASTIEIEQQLGELLDAWWRSESAERTAVLDDAAAWSAARQRRTAAWPPPAVTPCDGGAGASLAWPPPATGATARPGSMQRSVRELYDELAAMIGQPDAGGSIGDVSVAIGRVIDELGGRPAGAPLPPPRPDSAPAMAARAHAPGVPAAMVDTTTAATSRATADAATDERTRGDLRFVDSDEAFDRFWSSPRLDVRSRPRPILTDTLVPLVSVVAALTMVLAWIG